MNWPGTLARDTGGTLRAPRRPGPCGVGYWARLQPPCGRPPSPDRAQGLGWAKARPLASAPGTVATPPSSPDRLVQGLSNLA